MMVVISFLLQFVVGLLIFWLDYREVKKIRWFLFFMTYFHEHSHLHDGEVLPFGGDFDSVTITGIFTNVVLIKGTNYLPD